MCKKVMFLICFVLVLGPVGTVSAQHNWTNGDPANDLWTTAGNWDMASVPGPGDLALINSPPAQGPVINTDVTVGEIGGLRLNSDVDQVMEISSGDVEIGWWWGLAEGGNGTATLNMVGDAGIECGGIEAGYSGATVINIGGTTQIHSWEWRMCNEDAAALELNITDEADIDMGPEKNAWRFADKGMAVVNISGNPDIYIDGKWRNGDETGHIEINMSGGNLYVGRYLSCYDDGSATINFSGGTINVNGLSFSGRAGRDYELNISGTADVTAREMVRLRYGAGAGSPGGSAALNVSGGTLTCLGSIELEGAYGSMTVNLSGGVVSCASFNPNGPYSMDICGGTLIIDGDVTADIQADIDAGYILACGSAGTIIYDYDVRNPGKTTVTAALDGVVDIKPGSCPNALNLGSKGKLPVAILGTEDLDVTNIDPASVRLAGVAPLRSSLEDVGTPVRKHECACTERGADGNMDLTLKFSSAEIAVSLLNAPGGLVEGDVLVLTLTAEQIEGPPISGDDCVVLVGKVPREVCATRADCDKSGQVNLADLFLLKQHFGEAASLED
jgi:hypothetical protein